MLHHLNDYRKKCGPIRVVNNTHTTHSSSAGANWGQLLSIED